MDNGNNFSDYMPLHRYSETYLGDIILLIFVMEQY